MPVVFVGVALVRVVHMSGFVGVVFVPTCGQQNPSPGREPVKRDHTHQNWYAFVASRLSRDRTTPRLQV